MLLTTHSLSECQFELMGDRCAWKQLWFVEFSDLDPNVGPDVKVHVVTAVEDIVVVCK